MKWLTLGVIVVLLLDSVIGSESSGTTFNHFNYSNCRDQSSAQVSTMRSLSEKQVLKLSMTNHKKDFTVKICFGSPNPQCFNSRLVLNRFFTFIPDTDNSLPFPNKYDKTKSERSNIIYNSAMVTFDNNKEVRGKHLKETMWFNGELQVPNVLIMAASNSSSYQEAEGVLSLGYLPSSNEMDYSLIEQLASQGMISHKVFAIRYANDNEGLIEIGKIPTNALNDYRNYGRCRAFRSNDEARLGNRHWECLLRGFKVGDSFISDLLESPSKITFDYEIEHILVPLKFLLKLEESLFRKWAGEGRCNFGIKNEHYKLTCDSNDLFELNRVELIFEDWSLIIPKDHLFIYDEIDNEFEFILTHKEGSDQFVLGNSVLKLFDMVFDKDNEEVGFYSSTLVTHVSHNEIKKPVRHDHMQEETQTSEDGKEDKTFVPPFHPGDSEDQNPNDKIIPQKGPISFMRKFFISFGIILLIVFTLFAMWYAFRYYRRKHYSRKSFDYKKMNGIL